MVWAPSGLLLFAPMRSSFRALVLASVVLFADGAWATTTRVFRQTSAKDFEEGEATSTMVAPPGEVLPGMKSTRLAIDAAFAWCSALSPDHGTAYFGTGDRGRIFAVGTTANAASLLAQIDAPWVTALAVRPDGTLLAGSTPGGRIFVVDRRSGKSSVWAKLAAEHVWAIEIDAAHATTYAATGDGGKIFAIDAKGNARLLWDAGDKHVMALAKDGDALLAGTADKALVYRVHRDGHAEALHDFDADEVRAIVRIKGATFLAVNDFENPPDASHAKDASDAKDAPSGPQVAKGTRIVAWPAPASGSIARADALKAKGAIYRLDDDGRIEQLFALADGYFTGLLLDGAGNLLASAGSQGKIFRIAPDRTVALAAEISQRQALTMVLAGAGLFVGSGDVGAVYRVRPATGDAVYLSKVFDAETPARWGRLWWTGSQDLAWETRSGNTGKPDAGWSSFASLAEVSHPSGEHSGAVKSPSSRYVQYRVTFPESTSVLKDVSLYYLPHNQRARITEVFLADAAQAATGGASGSTAQAPSTRVHSSLLKLRWKTENPDNDDLIFKLWFKQQSDSVWRPLGGPDPLTKSEYDWNTDSVPDGRYVVRVWASDEKVTPGSQALNATFESQALLVDNTRPEVVGLSAQGTTILGRARDAASVVSTIEFAIDGGDWRPAQPDDGVLDEREEGFRAALPESLAPGLHIVNVRAWDSADNVGSARIEVRVQK